MNARPFFFVLLALISLAAHTGPLPRVMVVESYHADYAWDLAYKQALGETLAGKAELDYAQLDSKRQPPDVVATHVETAWARIAGTKPAVVVLADDAALARLGQRTRSAGLPTVFLGINNNPRAYALGPNTTGVLERALILRNISLARQLMPRLRRALILFDTDTTAHVLHQEVMHGRDRAQVAEIDVTWRMVDDWTTWQEVVRDAHRHYDALFVGLYHTVRDARQHPVHEDEVIRWTREHSQIPLFGYWDFAIGPDKAVGGMVLDGFEQGRLAGELVLAILAGTPPDRLPPRTAAHGHLLFSRQGLAHYGLTLPADLAHTSAWTD